MRTWIKITLEVVSWASLIVYGLIWLVLAAKEILGVPLTENLLKQLHIPFGVDQSIRMSYIVGVIIVVTFILQKFFCKHE